MRVFKVHRSIQGETSRVGLPMWFVRLAGCDLECTYCDTPEVRDPKAGRDMTVEEILATIDRSPLPRCLVTGGEPLLQIGGVNALAAALLDRGMEVLVETSGAHPIKTLDERVVRIVDVKAPGSGMAEQMHWPNLDVLTPRDEVKFVLTGRADYDWAKEVASRHHLFERVTVLLAAAHPDLQARVLAEWILADNLPARLNLQIHRLLGLP